MVFDQIQQVLCTVPNYVYITILIGIVGLFFTWKNYRRKAGILVHGDFQVTSGIYCKDTYVSAIILENQKDRAVTIFGIYVRLGFNYYIEIEDFEDKPLLLKAYESYKQDYPALHLYGYNANRFELNDLFNNKKVPKRIVLSTSVGKYIVPKEFRRWSPRSDFFRNYMTAHIIPVRIQYNDQYIGSNIKYLLELTQINGNKKFIHIPSFELAGSIFTNFEFTRESLESVKSLNIFLNKQIKAGHLTCQSITVHDVDIWRKRSAAFYCGETIKAEYHSFFRYRVLGRLWSAYQNWKSSRRNKKHNLKN